MSNEPSHKFELDYVFSYGLRFRAQPEVIGALPQGLRINVYYAGGSAVGPRVAGIFRPAGAGRMVLRPDGVGIIESRATIETKDGALIDVNLAGVLQVGEESMQKALRGDWPERIPYRGTPRYETADPRYAWLARMFCLSVGEIVPGGDEAVSADVYAVV